ncbi:hypothetical protein M0R45_014147 [Rubus argutus]|uniref:Uncharacterized protein n=1 Tax=Rubus argutus TaxID=59490 RepID=A0AAW1XN89_RUBAR
MSLEYLEIGGGLPAGSVLQTISVDRNPKISHLFNVKSYGAKADGQTDDSKAFTAAWKEACQSKGRVHLIIPRGTYMVGPLRFSGPCQNVSSLSLRVKGYLKATTVLSKYEFGGGWIEFAWMEGLSLTGGGTFDGQGAKAWLTITALKTPIANFFQLA